MLYRNFIYVYLHVIQFKKLGLKVILVNGDWKEYKIFVSR
jgi:hypothetical protein